MKSTRLKLVGLIFALLTCAMILLAQAQEHIWIYILVDEDSLTVYIPGNVPVSLEGFGFDREVLGVRGVKTLSDYFEFDPQRTFNTPVCFRLKRDGARTSLYSECPDYNTLVKKLNVADVFWWDDENNGPKPFTIMEGSEPGPLCPSPKICSVIHPPLDGTGTPTPVPPATVTPVPCVPQVAGVEPVPPPGYTIYDDFDWCGTGGWETTNDSPLCTRDLANGSWKIECFGSATEIVKFTMLPADVDATAVEGVAMAFYTLPVQANSSQWGKYQLQVRFGSDCSSPERAYNISIRPTELSFVENDAKFNALNSPVPKRTIDPIQPQVIKIEYQDGQVELSLNDENVLSVTPPSGTSWYAGCFRAMTTAIRHLMVIVGCMFCGLQ